MPPICASEEMLVTEVEAERARGKCKQDDVNRNASKHTDDTGAGGHPAEVALRSRTATSIASSALASGAGPGTARRRALAMIKPATVAMITSRSRRASSRSARM